MKFTLIIDKEKDEQIVATVHQRTTLTDEIEALVLKYSGADRIPAYTEDDMKMLTFSEIECVTVLDGKKELIEVETASPEAYVKENGRFPIVDISKNTDGDTVITTGDGNGNFVKYTFTE